MLSIGAFSKISGMSTNALRYYDEIGLLRPVQVGSDNGYRYYAAAQLQTVLLINRLKSYHLSLEEIAQVLWARQDEGLQLLVMRQRRDRMRQKLEHLTGTLSQIEQDILNLERGIPIMENLDHIRVELKEMEPKTILFIREMMSTKDYALHLARLAETIRREKLTVTGAPLTVFHVAAEEFDPGYYDNEIAIPVRESIEGARQLPGGLCAVVTLHGPYTGLASVYARLEQWLEQEGYTLAGQPYEVYATDPNVTPAEENITEVYYPVKKQQASA